MTIYKFPTNMDDGDHDGIDPDLGKYLRLGKYLCDLCPSVFTSKAGLNDHVKSFHLGEKRFSCDKCGKMVRSDFSVLIKTNFSSFSEKINCCSIWMVMQRRKCIFAMFVVREFFTLFERFHDQMVLNNLETSYHFKPSLYLTSLTTSFYV